MFEQGHKICASIRVWEVNVCVVMGARRQGDCSLMGVLVCVLSHEPIRLPLPAIATVRTEEALTHLLTKQCVSWLKNWAWLTQSRS